jgi:hypothetical protein
MLTPVHATVGQAGQFGVYSAVTGSGQGGGYRVQNAIEGYVAWVNAGSPPDLTQPPGYFSATLPFAISTPAPGSGSTTYYVVVAYRDSYGLISPNQYTQTITVTAAGHLTLPPVAAPAALSLYPRAGDTVRLLTSYAGFQSDPYPADVWKVWAGSVVPNPSVDTPVLTTPVSGPLLAANFGPFTPGVLYFAVGLYRTGDASLSSVTSGSVVVADVPPPPIPLP